MMKESKNYKWPEITTMICTIICTVVMMYGLCATILRATHIINWNWFIIVIPMLSTYVLYGTVLPLCVYGIPHIKEKKNSKK